MKRLIITTSNNEDFTFEEGVLLNTNCEQVLKEYTLRMNRKIMLLDFESIKEDVTWTYNREIMSIKHKVKNVFNIDNIVAIQMIETIKEEE